MTSKCCFSSIYDIIKNQVSIKCCYPKIIIGNITSNNEKLWIFNEHIPNQRFTMIQQSFEQLYSTPGNLLQQSIEKNTKTFKKYIIDEWKYKIEKTSKYPMQYRNQLNFLADFESNDNTHNLFDIRFIKNIHIESNDTVGIPNFKNYDSILEQHYETYLFFKIFKIHFVIEYDISKKLQTIKSVNKIYIEIIDDHIDYNDSTIQILFTQILSIIIFNDIKINKKATYDVIRKFYK